ncbi:VOC family protein [Metabacillus mangrovi]
MQNQTITPFFMFSGQAEEAMKFYTAVSRDWASRASSAMRMEPCSMRFSS